MANNCNNILQKIYWTWWSVQSLVKTILWFIWLDLICQYMGYFHFPFFEIWSQRIAQFPCRSLLAAGEIGVPPRLTSTSLATAVPQSVCSMPACLYVCMISTFNFCQHSCDSSSKKWIPRSKGNCLSSFVRFWQCFSLCWYEMLAPFMSFINPLTNYKKYFQIAKYNLTPYFVMFVSKLSPPLLTLNCLW